MGDACSLEPLSIEISILVHIASALLFDMKSAAIGQLERVFREQGQVQQIVIGASIGIETHHVEGQPRGHGTRVVITRQAIGAVAVVVDYDLMHALGTQVRATYPMVKARRKERRFVLHIVVTLFEEEIEALAELLLTPTGTDKSWYVVWNRERILFAGGFVEERRPPRQIPWSDFRDWRIGNRRMENLRMSPRHRVHPTPVGAFRKNKSLHAIPFVVSTPKVAPVARLRHILFIKVLTAKAAGHLSDAPIVEGIFNGTISGTVDAIGNVAETVVLRKSATTMLLMVGLRINGSILEHGFKGKGVVDARKTFGKSIGDDHLGIGTALGTSVAVATTGIRHVAFSRVYI